MFSGMPYKPVGKLVSPSFCNSPQRDLCWAQWANWTRSFWTSDFSLHRKRANKRKTLLYSAPDLTLWGENVARPDIKKVHDLKTTLIRCCKHLSTYYSMLFSWRILLPLFHEPSRLLFPLTIISDELQRLFLLGRTQRLKKGSKTLKTSKRVIICHDPKLISFYVISTYPQYFSPQDPSC